VGRKPHDAATLWLHGAKSQAHEPTESSIPAARAPKYPRGLPPALRRPFRDMCATLRQRRALTDGDAELVGLYVCLADRRTRALAAVETEGLLITETRFSSNGEPSSRRIKNPHLLIAQESEKQMTAILRDLCLTVATKDKTKPTRARPAEELTDDEAFELWEAQQGENQNDEARRAH